MNETQVSMFYNPPVIRKRREGEFGIAEATYSHCEQYRYVLWRQWDTDKPAVTFIGLNPSTATEEKLDPTVTRCARYAKAWGYGGIFMLNIFAFRSTDPKRLYEDGIEPKGEHNDSFIEDIARISKMIVCCWGQNGKLYKRHDEVLDLLSGNLLHVLKLTKSGYPHHPLYLKSSLVPQEWIAT